MCNKYNALHYSPVQFIFDDISTQVLCYVLEYSFNEWLNIQKERFNQLHEFNRFFSQIGIKSRKKFKKISWIFIEISEQLIFYTSTLGLFQDAHAIVLVLRAYYVTIRLWYAPWANGLTVPNFKLRDTTVCFKF